MRVQPQLPAGWQCQLRVQGSSRRKAKHQTLTCQSEGWATVGNCASRACFSLTFADNSKGSINSLLISVGPAEAFSCSEEFSQPLHRGCRLLISCMLLMGPPMAERGPWGESPAAACGTKYLLWEAFVQTSQIGFPPGRDGLQQGNVQVCCQIIKKTTHTHTPTPLWFGQQRPVRLV